MEEFIFNMLQEKGREAGLDIFQMEAFHGSPRFIIRYHDGEIDFNTHKLVIKEFEAKSTDSLDDVIQKIKRESNLRVTECAKTNFDLLKELLDNPRVEKISIDYKKVGNVGIAKIEADLNG